MYERQDIQLIKERSNERKREKYDNVVFTMQLAIFLFITLADNKGYVGDYKVTVSAVAKIHSYLDVVGS